MLQQPPTPPPPTPSGPESIHPNPRWLYPTLPPTHSHVCSNYPLVSMACEHPTYPLDLYTKDRFIVLPHPTLVPIVSHR
eukprot:767777-Hanusia_phi.AAC.1